MNESESAQHGCVFDETQPNIRKWFRRCVGSETRSRLCGVRDQARAASEQRDDYRKCGTWMPEYLNRKQRATNRANHRVNSIPGGVDPRNFVGEKFEEIKNAGDRNNHGIAQHFERLIRWCERDPVAMDGQPGGENREIKVDAGKASQAERDRKKIQLLHGAIIRRG